MLLVLFLLLPGAGAAQEPAGEAREGAGGPAPLRILAPIHQIFYQLAPTAAEVLPAGRWGVEAKLSESNVLHDRVRGADPLFTTFLDFEMSRFELALRRGLGGRGQVGIEIPVLRTHSGFLDELVFDIEDAVGKLKPRRRVEVPNRFGFEVSRGGEPLFTGRDDETGVGDVAVAVDWLFGGRRGDRTSGVLLRGAVELPTGDRDLTFGSDTVDVALGVAADWHRRRWTYSLGGGVTAPLGDVESTPGVEALPTVYGYGEVGYRASRLLSLHLQVGGQTPPFEADEVSGVSLGETDSLDGHVVQVRPALGFHLGAGRGTFWLGIDEDFLNSDDAASDVTLFMVWSGGG